MGASLCLGQVSPSVREDATELEDVCFQGPQHGLQTAEAALQPLDADPFFKAKDEPALARIVLTAARHGHTGVLSVIIDHACRGYNVPEIPDAAFAVTSSCPSEGPCLMQCTPIVNTRERLRSIIDARTPLSQTPLMVAAFYAHEHIVRQLLSVGADPWIKSQPYNRTALHYAALSGSAGCLRALLEAVPLECATRYANLRTTSGFTALGYAVASHSVDAVKVLLGARADVALANTVQGADAPDFCALMSTPLHMAAMVGSRSIAIEILRYHIECVAGGATVTSGSCTMDIRTRVDISRRRPCDIARLLGNEELSQLMHPSLPLESLFASDADPRYIGVPRLRTLAASVLKASLLASCAAINGAQQAAPDASIPSRGDTGNLIMVQEISGVLWSGDVADGDGRPSDTAPTTAAATRTWPSLLVVSELSSSLPLSEGDGWRERSAGARAHCDGEGRAVVGALHAPLSHALSNTNSPSILPTDLHTLLVDPCLLFGPGRSGLTRAGGIGPATEHRCRPHSDVPLPSAHSRHGSSSSSTAVLAASPSAAAVTTARSGGMYSATDSLETAFQESRGFGPGRAALASRSISQRSVRQFTSRCGDASIANASGWTGGMLEPCGVNGSIHSSNGSTSGAAAAAAPCKASSFRDSSSHRYSSYSSDSPGRASSSSDMLCGVCYDRLETVRSTSCKHRLCTACAVQIVRQVKAKPALCPFCRTPFAGFAAVE